MPMPGMGPGTVWFIGIDSVRSAASLGTAWEVGKRGDWSQEHPHITRVGRLVLAEEGGKSLGVKARSEIKWGVTARGESKEGLMNFQVNQSCWRNRSLGSLTISGAAIVSREETGHLPSATAFFPMPLEKWGNSYVLRVNEALTQKTLQRH